MDFFHVVSVCQAKKQIIESFPAICLKSESIELKDALDRILAEDIHAPENVPPFQRSTVDGYALKSKDSYGVSDFSPGFLDLIGEVQMALPTSLEVKTGQSAYVPTGGMIPKGADAVIMVEYTEKLGDMELAIHRPVANGENLVHVGDDIQQSQPILLKGMRITPIAIGTLAALGITKVNVFEKPKFCIISTGDEIIDIDQKMSAGKIRDINGYALEGLIRKTGGVITGRTIVPDDFEALRQQAQEGMAQAHIIIISGGSSVGTKDFTCQVIDSFDGKGVFIHGISIKPGKPTIIGEAQGKAIFGLPGHPVSAIIIYKVLIEYLVRHRLSRPTAILSGYKATLTANLHSSPGKETYQMVRITRESNSYYAEPIYGKSGMITLLLNAHGYIILDDTTEGLPEGALVDVFAL